MILSLGLLLVVAFLGRRVVHGTAIPEILAFLAAGLLLGPNVLGIVDEEAREALQPLAFVAVGLVLLVMSERLRPAALRAELPHVGPFVGLSLVATVALVFVGLRLAGWAWPQALVAATAAAAAAPATLRTIARTRNASGPAIDRVLSAQVINDTAVVLLFGVALSIAQAAPGLRQDGGAELLQNAGGGVALGVLGGLLLAGIVTRSRLFTEAMTIAVAVMIVTVGLTDRWDVSPMLAVFTLALVVPWVLPPDTHRRLIDGTRAVEEPAAALFFAVAGASLHVAQLRTVIIPGLAYVLARALGKFPAGVLGARLAGFQDMPVAAAATLLPHGTIAVGLAVVAADQLGSVGEEIETVVLGSLVLYEVLAPPIAARAISMLASESLPGGRAFVPDHGIERVLLPLSSSHLVRSRLDALVAIAGRFAAELVFLHVCEPGHADPGFQEAVHSVRERGFSARLRLVETESFQPGLVVRAILDAAADERVDLIVLGGAPEATSPRSTVVDAVIDQTATPVLVFPWQTDMDPPR